MVANLINVETQLASDAFLECSHPTPQGQEFLIGIEGGLAIAKFSANPPGTGVLHYKNRNVAKTGGLPPSLTPRLMIIWRSAL